MQQNQDSSLFKGGVSYNNTRHDASYPSNLHDTLDQEQYQVLVRAADLDDIGELERLMGVEAKEAFDILYDYPKLVTLFERSVLSVTMLDSNQKIIGCAVFNDYPQGLNGKIDFLHENFWEQWLFDSFQFEENLCITPQNSLWLTYLFVAKDAMSFVNREELVIVEKVFQNIYSTKPEVEGILYLKRGEAQSNQLAENEVKDVLEAFFVNVPSKNRDILKKVQGIHAKSDLYYSPKDVCTEFMQIRMAREQDHDDLAEIFNRQSDVLTSQFGEFFIADLIATQNLTRRISKKFKADGKAIVGQVKDKAVGLMSVSTEIDYRLLEQCFQLETFDNLFKPEFMDALRVRREEIREEEQIKKLEERRQILRRLEEEKLKCHRIGQRMSLQQYCVDMGPQIIQELIEIISNEEKQKVQSMETVKQMINKWMQQFQPHHPSEIFEQYPDYAPDIQCMILSPVQFLLETLEFYDLPQDYMLGAGHWKNWVQEKRRQEKEKNIRKPNQKSKKTNKKIDIREQYKKPDYFDLKPLKEAFEKFIEVNAEERTRFRQQIESNLKKVVMLFCNQNGEMISERGVDLNELGNVLRDKGIEIPDSTINNMASFLKCFGEISFDEETIEVIPKEEDKGVKKDQQAPKKPIQIEENPKPIKKVLKKANYADFENAINTFKMYDLMMRRLDHIKSKLLQDEVKALTQKEEIEWQKVKQSMTTPRERNEFYKYVLPLTDTTSLPQEIPVEAQNAVVINLFCIDENYESRSMEFVEYAFSLFPNREYIILSQPYTAQETTLLQNFIQIPMKKNSTFDHVLYVYHKDHLQANAIFVRRSKLSDIEDALPLFEGLLNNDQIRNDCEESIRNSASNKECFTVFCDQQLIGIYVVSKTVNLDYYISHFCIQDHLILKEHPKQFHTRLIHSILNPLFYKSTRFILREILRLIGKTVLYFEVNQRTLLPDIFNELIFVRARTFPHFLKRKWDFQHESDHYERAGDKSEVLDGTRDPFDQEEAPFSLSLITKKMLATTKVSNNSRIVVVGASDTGISFIESLLTIKDINFTHITLLAPGGLTTMHVHSPADQLKAMSTNYTLDELRNLMLDARVSVLDAKMVKLEKKQRRIKLDKNAYLPYDFLIIAVGLIDTELQQRDLISSGLADSPHYIQELQKEDNKFKIIRGVYSIDDPYLYEHFKVTYQKNSNIDLLTRKKKPQNITVFGRTLHTFTFITGLMNRGVAPERITYVVPQRLNPKPTELKTNEQKMEYEDKCINDPDPFEDETVEQQVLDSLSQLGVVVHHGYNIHEIKTDPTGQICKSIVIRKKADKFDEIQLQIELKEQEVKERDNDSENQSRGLDNGDLDEQGEVDEQKISAEQEIEELKQLLYDDIDIESRFFVTSGLVDIDNEIFFVIHENGLVYNGRLIVKNNFQTSTEKEIFCCGKICEFSQRYKKQSTGRSLRLDKYNGREMGQKLSKCILEELGLSYLTDNMLEADQLPQLYMPIGIGSYLPKGFYYYHIKKNDWAKPKIASDKPANREPIVSNNLDKKKGNYIAFKFDNNGLIDQVTFYGQEAVNVQSLISFVGLSEKYLNRLDSRFKNGMIPDISEFLSENWAMGLYHEWFSEFRFLIKSEILQSENVKQILAKAEKHAYEGGYMDQLFYDEIKKSISPDIIKAIQEGTLDFVKENQNHLPMYYIPSEKLSIKKK